jgi:hypothetical protein
MELSVFINTLLSEGTVTVQGQIVSFDQADVAATEQILLQYYQQDLLEMPGLAPVYSAGAALWAAHYFYVAIQLTVLRDVGEDVIKEQLKPFAGEVNPSSIYSADLILRYLPELFNLAKGLAPADLLVKELQDTAGYWPFSSVGIELNSLVNDDILFTHPSLKYAYLDRIIRHRDKKRIINTTTENYIAELTGEHVSILWPGYEPAFK